MTEDPSTREKILDVTRKLTTSTPLEEITTRRIATEAGVNIAAINYHFRTKEKLIGEAVTSFAATALEHGLAILRDTAKSAAERLIYFLQGYAKGLVGAPAVTRTAFRTFLFDEPADGQYHLLVKQMLSAMTETLAEASGPSNNAVIAENTLALFSSIAMPILANETFSGAGVPGLSDGKARDEYVARMVHAFIQANADSE